MQLGDIVGGDSVEDGDALENVEETDGDDGEGLDAAVGGGGVLGVGEVEACIITVLEGVLLGAEIVVGSITVETVGMLPDTTVAMVFAVGIVLTRLVGVNVLDRVATTNGEGASNTVAVAASASGSGRLLGLGLSLKKITRMPMRKITVARISCHLALKISCHCCSRFRLSLSLVENPVSV